VEAPVAAVLAVAADSAVDLAAAVLAVVALLEAGKYKIFEHKKSYKKEVNLELDFFFAFVNYCIMIPEGFALVIAVKILFEAFSASKRL
jgi:hypothetical protein